MRTSNRPPEIKSSPEQASNEKGKGVKMPKKAITPEIAAEMLSLGRTTIYALISCGKLRSFTEGRRRLIPVEAIDEYVEARLAEDTEGGNSWAA